MALTQNFFKEVRRNDTCPLIILGRSHVHEFVELLAYNLELRMGIRRSLSSFKQFVIPLVIGGRFNMNQC